MQTNGSQSYQSGLTGSLTIDGCSPASGHGQAVEQKVMFVFGSVLFVALMAYGAALNVLLDSDVEDTFA